MAILNPYEEELPTIPGTRILVETFGLIGCRFSDPREPARRWTVLSTLKPLFSRSHLGIRARVLDQLGFVSVVVQQDLELLTYHVKPGDLCPWTQEAYPEIGDENAGWRGLYMDDEDLDDDLHIRELEIRQQFNWTQLPELQLTRRIHTANQDLERIDMLLRDYDPDTGIGPDPSIDTLRRRWVRVQQEPVSWTML